MRDDVPFPERIGRVVVVGLRDHDSADAFGQSQAAAQGVVFDGLNQFKSLRFAVVYPVFDVVQKKLDFLHRNQITDVLSVLNQTENQTRELAIRDRRPAAVAEVERSVHLNAQPRGLIVIVCVFDPRNDSLGYGKLGAAGRIAIDVDGVFDSRQLVGERQRAALVKKRFVVKLQYRQVHSRRHRLDPSRQVTRGLVRLHVYLAGVAHHVSVGEDAFAVDDDSRSFYLLRNISHPWSQQIGSVMNGVNLHHEIADLILGPERCGLKREKANGGTGGEQSRHGFSLVIGKFPTVEGIIYKKARRR